MSKIDTTQWEDFVITEFVEPVSVKNKLSKLDLMENAFVPVQSSETLNNGIIGFTDKEAEFFVKQDEFYIIFGDHTKSINIAEYNFCVMDNVKVLKPKIYNKRIIMYIITVWKKAIPELGYARHWGIAKNIKFKLPIDRNSNPNFAYMEQYMQNLESAVSSSLTALWSAKSSKTCERVDIQKWKQFKIGDIFPEIIKPEVYHTRQLTQDSNGIPYVVRSKFNNGIKYRVKKPIGKINPPNVISFGAENATFFYQQEEWVSGRDMYYIKVGNLPFYACCFLTSVFQILATKYSYNNGLFPDKLKKEKIMLPVNIENGKIDYSYMEEYMKKKFLDCKDCLSAIATV